jgi:hypothetical protein
VVVVIVVAVHLTTGEQAPGLLRLVALPSGGAIRTFRIREDAQSARIQPSQHRFPRVAYSIPTARAPLFYRQPAAALRP